MYATYRLRADELNEGLIQTLKNTYQQHEIIILSKEDYDEELEKVRHNTAFTEKLQQRVKALDEGKSIVKTMVELEALADG
jgi:predicted nucleic acid-binding protein